MRMSSSWLEARLPTTKYLDVLLVLEVRVKEAQGHDSQEQIVELESSNPEQE